MVGAFCIGAAAFAMLISVVAGLALASAGWIFGYLLLGLVPCVLILLIVGTVLVLVGRKGWVDGKGRFSSLMLAAAGLAGVAGGRTAA